MKKIDFARHIISIIIMFLLLNIPVDSQETLMVIDNSAFEIQERPPVFFNHDQHNENAELENCAICHHVYEEGHLVPDESSEDQACSECHTEEVTAAKIPLMKAYHQKCKACHFQQKKGPFMCCECHKKT